MKDTQHNGSPCPTCGKVLDGSMHPGDATPAEGDFSMCAYCAQPLRYSKDLMLVAASDEELKLLEGESLAFFREMQRFIKERKKA